MKWRSETLASRWISGRIEDLILGSAGAWPDPVRSAILREGFDGSLCTHRCLCEVVGGYLLHACA